MLIKTSLLVSFVAASALAQGTQMPIPAFSNTYSYATHTRGFYFQAPTGAPFVIAGLRVPDETSHGTQNVEVIRFAQDPTSTTVTGTQAFFSSNQPSANIIPCSVLVNPGEWIGVLGACGDATIMHNSYGAGGFASNVLGAPVTLNRLYCQANINATGGNQPVYGTTGSLARVEVYVAPAAGYSQSNPYGDGCGGVQDYSTYYEQFPSGGFDLGGSPGAETVLQHLNAGSGYVVLPGAPAWFPPAAPDLGLADDQVSAALPLGFTMTFPGAGPSITDIYVSSNGFIWLANNTNSDLSSSVAELLSQDPRIAMFWQDLRPASGNGTGTIHFDSDPVNGVAYVTFDGVEQYNNSAALVSVQCALFANGGFELRYGAESMSIAGTSTPLIGYSPGNGALTPPESDLSVLPIFTQPDRFVPNMSLVSDRPVEGSNVTMTIAAIPAGTVLGTLILSPTQVFPGVQPIGGLGSCFQHVGLDNVSYFLPTGSTHVFSLGIPASGYTGAQVFLQSITLSPGVSAQGVAASNGLQWVVDRL